MGCWWIEQNIVLKGRRWKKTFLKSYVILAEHWTIRLYVYLYNIKILRIFFVTFSSHSLFFQVFLSQTRSRFLSLFSLIWTFLYFHQRIFWIFISCTSLPLNTDGYIKSLLKKKTYGSLKLKSMTSGDWIIFQEIDWRKNCFADSKMQTKI